MANATISIQFTTLPTLSSSVQINIQDVTTLQLTPLFELFYSSRYTSRMIPLSECGTLDNTAKAYAKYLALDYGTSLFTVQHNIGTATVVLTMKTANYKFIKVASTYLDLQTVTEVAPTIDVSTFTLDSVVFSEATDPYNNVRLTILTTGLAKEIWLNSYQTNITSPTIDNNVANPIIIDVPRGFSTNIKLVDSQGIVRWWGPNNYEFPFFYSSSIIIDVNETIVGATVTATVNYRTLIYQQINSLTDLVFEYSLDNTNWQTSNFFSGQAPGDYTIYIRDQYGVTRTKDFTVNGIDSTKDAFLFISKANSLNFKEIAEWDGYTIFKDEDNTLEYQSLEQIKYCFPLMFQTNDSTKIQLKSNFTDVEAKVRKEDGTEQALTVTKLTKNINRFESLDAKYYEYSGDYTAIYFENGDKYDENGFKISEYILSGNLPDLAIKGQYIEVVGLGAFLINDVIFDSNINKKVILISSIYTGVDIVECVVKSTYDLLPFDVYEFQINWSDFGIGLYDVVITNHNNGSDTIVYASENINILAEHDQTLAVRYFNKNNRDIFYKFGIEHFIRVAYSGISRGFDEEFEVSKGDLISATTESKLRFVDEFVFTDLTTGQMRTLAIALSCEMLYINNVGYVKNSALEVEQIPNTNLYEVKASLLRTNVNYTINRQGQTGRDINYVDFDIPKFVYTGTGFLTT